MTLNIFKIKRIVSYYIPSLFSLATFIILILFGWGFVLSLILSVVISIALSFAMYRWTKHPLLASLEGQGLLVLNIDSKGIIKMNLAKIVPEGDTVKLVLPNGKDFIFKRDELTYLLWANDVGMPVLLYNENIGMPITKEDLMYKEKMYLEHIDLEILHKATELSKYMRDFARYIIEQMKPKKLLNLGSLKWILIIIFIVILFIIVLPMLGIGNQKIATNIVAGAMANSTIP